MSGTIERRGKTSWRLQVSEGFDEDGDRVLHRRTIRENSKAEAKRQLAAFSTEISKGHYAELASAKFRDYSDEWLRKRGEDNLSPKTLHDYRRLLARIKRSMGHLALDKIRPKHIEDFFAELQAEGGRGDGKEGKLSATSVKYYHSVLRKMFNDAERLGYIANNIMKKVIAPKVRRKEARHYEDHQVDLILHHLTNEDIKFQAIIHVALFGGLRRREVLGLKWDDIDLSGGRISAIRSVQYIPPAKDAKGGEILSAWPTGVQVLPPKTDSSTRQLFMPEQSMDILKQYRRSQVEKRLTMGDKWQENGFVFTTDEGRLMYPDTPTRWWSKFNKRYGLPAFPFHGLTHTCASMLMQSHVTLTDVSKHLGHEQVSTTANIYGHVQEQSKRAIADTFKDRIGKSETMQS